MKKAPSQTSDKHPASRPLSQLRTKLFNTSGQTSFTLFQPQKTFSHSKEPATTTPYRNTRLAALLDFDLATLIKRHLQNADKLFWQAFTTAFTALNIIFLFHGARFLFGDHDWKYLKGGIPPNAGLFEGRFAQFLPINLLSGGDILPIVNNVLGFAGFSLGIALLARYWRLPQRQSAYVLFALFTSVTPYVLSFMYFAFLVVPVLSWNAFVTSALLISEKEERFSLWRTGASTFLLTLALGGYPPVINLIAIAITVRWLFAVLFGELQTLPGLLYRYRWTLINLLLTATCYKLCLWGLSQIGAINTAYYNLQTTPVSEWGNKLLLVSKDTLLQFTATLPFITAPYKIVAGIVALCGATTLLLRLSTQSAENSLVATKKNAIKSKILSVALFATTVSAPLATLFISADRAQTEFAPRIDFFGFMYFYAAMLTLCQKNAATSEASGAKLLKNLSFAAAIGAIIISANNLFAAQKVWKLGFDAEMKLYRRAAARFMSDPAFYPGNRYIMVQGGSPAFRPRFYHKPYRYSSDDLLGTSYVPGMNPSVMWNYYGVSEYGFPEAFVYTFRPTESDAEIIKNARPWPSPKSTAVIQTSPSSQNWILLLLTPDGHTGLKNTYNIR